MRVGLWCDSDDERERERESATAACQVVSHVAASSFLFSLLFFGTYRFFNMEEAKFLELEGEGEGGGQLDTICMLRVQNSLPFHVIRSVWWLDHNNNNLPRFFKEGAGI